MSNSLVILDVMPSPSDFYGQYWNRQPFLVRGAIPADTINNLIAADELAGLSLEEAPQSRMVKTAGDHHAWSCDYGPFTEDDFSTAGDADWSLLVQNVEQFHPDTAALLQHFDFTPRWLMDDIMVSYSATGGSVGPHIDSYHVFLVQGQGTRRWKIGREAIRDEVYIDGIDLRVLKDDFDGDEIEAGLGDVLYLPPKFAHEGTTIDPSLTFSVGFLGPKISELYSGYGQYLSECENLDLRYIGDGLKSDSAGFAISSAAVSRLQNNLSDHLGTKNFTEWLVEFFTGSSHEDFGHYTEREDVLTNDDLAAALNGGATLFKPQYIKFAITEPTGGTFYFAFDRQSFTLDERLMPLVQKLSAHEVGLENTPTLIDHPATLEFLLELYNHQALEFAP